ncbi:MAG: anion transporter [Alphaproteobacteria bacterium]|nr:anion transporter [Alphaproteobacteria bacterium]
MNQGLVVTVFVLVYAAMALGRWPGLALDRTGAAVIGAIVLVAVGAADTALVLSSIDFSTLVILFALMVLSAQFAASGFFEWCAEAIAATRASPTRILTIVVAVGGTLAAVLTNDVVVWAMTPVLVRGLVARRLDPKPYVVALAMAANAGSAATLIGNPQNLLIAGAGKLEFWPFIAACGVPALVALVLVRVVVGGLSRRALHSDAASPSSGAGTEAPSPPERAALAKGAFAAAAVIAVFTLPVDRAHWMLAVAGLLLLSRRLSTRRMLSMVDWHLLLLFAALFVVTGTLAASGVTARAVAALGADTLRAPATFALAALVGSNTIGNVPLVIVMLSAGLDLGTAQLYALALFSTLSGNLLVVGSLANIIAVERAGAEGVTISFADYARLGVPVTLASFVFAWVWLQIVLV